MQKTTLAKKGEAGRGWLIIDLKDKVLGRAATRIANILRGKHKVTFTPHEEMGDTVVVINAASVKLTGKKATDKIYYHHTGYIGGIKAEAAGKLRDRNSAAMIRRAVHGMLPKNKMNKHLLRNLHVYSGAEHPHAAQLPVAVEV